MSNLFAQHAKEDQEADKRNDDDDDDLPGKKLSWEDLDYLWKNFGIGVSQIQQLKGYEDFEVTDSSVLDSVSPSDLEENKSSAGN